MKEKKEKKEKNGQEGQVGVVVEVGEENRKEEEMERSFWSFFLLRCDKDFFLSDEKREEKKKRFEEEERKKEKEKEKVVVGINTSDAQTSNQSGIFPAIPTIPPANEGGDQNGVVNTANTTEPAKKKWSFFKK